MKNKCYFFCETNSKCRRCLLFINQLVHPHRQCTPRIILFSVSNTFHNTIRRQSQNIPKGWRVFQHYNHAPPPVCKYATGYACRVYVF